jgi:hypothetical protein
MVFWTVLSLTKLAEPDTVNVPFRGAKRVGHRRAEGGARRSEGN